MLFAGCLQAVWESRRARERVRTQYLRTLPTATYTKYTKTGVRSGAERHYRQIQIKIRSVCQQTPSASPAPSVVNPLFSVSFGALPWLSGAAYLAELQNTVPSAENID
jgi:hypothetical protein